MSRPLSIILRLPREVGLEALCPWWQADVSVAVESQWTWVRFNATDQTLVEQSRAIPAERFNLNERWLVREGARIAEAELPDLEWSPLAQVLKLQLPWTGTAGRMSQLKPLHWRLVRGGCERPIAAAIIAWDTLSEWVDVAPQQRLSPLRFVVSESLQSRQALVLGTPVPPLESQYLVAVNNILIPAGMHWLPTLDTNSVLRSFDVQEDQWLCWLATDDWYLLDNAMFAPLTRGNVRCFASGGKAL